MRASCVSRQKIEWRKTAASIRWLTKTTGRLKKKGTDTESDALSFLISQSTMARDAHEQHEGDERVMVRARPLSSIFANLVTFVMD